MSGMRARLSGSGCREVDGRGEGVLLRTESCRDAAGIFRPCWWIFFSSSFSLDVKGFGRFRVVWDREG